MDIRFNLEMIVWDFLLFYGFNIKLVLIFLLRFGIFFLCVCGNIRIYIIGFLFEYLVWIDKIFIKLIYIVEVWNVNYLY